MKSVRGFFFLIFKVYISIILGYTWLHLVLETLDLYWEIKNDVHFFNLRHFTFIGKENVNISVSKTLKLV